MSETTRVFLLEPVKQDTQDAREFGEITYLFKYGEQRPSIFSIEYQDELEKRFIECEFDPENDLFVLTGFQIAISIAVAVLTKMFKNFEILCFYVPTHSYTIISVGKVKERT